MSHKIKIKLRPYVSIKILRINESRLEMTSVQNESEILLTMTRIYSCKSDAATYEDGPLFELPPLP